MNYTQYLNKRKTQKIEITLYRKPMFFRLSWHNTIKKKIKYRNNMPPENILEWQGTFILIHNDI